MRCDHLMCEKTPIWSEVYVETHIPTSRHYCDEHQPIVGSQFWNPEVEYEEIDRSWFFTVTLRGVGQTKEKAWEDAINHYQDRPQEMPDDRHIVEEKIESMVYLLACVTGEGYLLGCTKKFAKDYEAFWADHYEDAGNWNDDPEMIWIEVPEDMAENLLSHGSSVQYYDNGREAWQDIMKRGRIIGEESDKR